MSKKRIKEAAKELKRAIEKHTEVVTEGAVSYKKAQRAAARLASAAQVYAEAVTAKTGLENPFLVGGGHLDAGATQSLLAERDSIAKAVTGVIPVIDAPEADDFAGDDEDEAGDEADADALTHDENDLDDEDLDTTVVADEAPAPVSAFAPAAGAVEAVELDDANDDVDITLIGSADEAGDRLPDAAPSFVAAESFAVVAGTAPVAEEPADDDLGGDELLAAIVADAAAEPAPAAPADAIVPPAAGTPEAAAIAAAWSAVQPSEPTPAEESEDSDPAPELPAVEPSDPDDEDKPYAEDV